MPFSRLNRITSQKNIAVKQSQQLLKARLGKINMHLHLHSIWENKLKTFYNFFVIQANKLALTCLHITQISN